MLSCFNHCSSALGNKAGMDPLLKGIIIESVDGRQFYFQNDLLTAFAYFPPRQNSWLKIWWVNPMHLFNCSASTALQRALMPTLAGEI